jgi:hypothetical protein
MRKAVTDRAKRLNGGTPSELTCAERLRQARIWKAGVASVGIRLAALRRKEGARRAQAAAVRQAPASIPLATHSSRHDHYFPASR